MDMSCAQYSLLNVLIETKFQVEFEQDTAALVWVNKHKHLKDTYTVSISQFFMLHVIYSFLAGQK